MSTRAQRGKAPYTRSPQASLGDEGVERYMWVSTEENQIVLTIPGLRDLKLGVDDARAIGTILIQTADEMTKHRHNREEGDNDHRNSGRSPVNS